MYKNLEIINTIEHKNSSIKQVENFLYAKEQVSVPVTIAEFFEACKNYPILFAKDTNNQWFASVMLGYKEKENLFLDENGTWAKNHYIPAFIRRYPFVFVTQPNEQLALAVESEYKSEDKKDDTRKLFGEDGQNSEFLSGVLNFLTQFQTDAKATAEFIKQLEVWELLEEKNATISTPNNETYNINGFYIVNEEKLKHLSKKKKEDICNNNAFPLITAHLISLSNISKL